MDTTITQAAGTDLGAGTSSPLGATVVVPVDGSKSAERTLSVASALAERLHGRVEVMSAGWAVDEAQTLAQLEALSAQLEPAAHTRYVTSGAPADAIWSVANEIGNAVVCMATHGRGRLRWAAVGSVAEEVVRRAPAPVVLVGRHCNPEWPTSFEHLMVCVDGSTVADPIVPSAIRWAKALALDVCVAHAIHPLDVEGATHPDSTVEAICERFRAEGLRAESAVLRSSSFVPGALADHAATLPAALVAMSSHTRHALARVALGSVAMGTVALVSCPVLVMPVLPEA